MPDIKLPPLVRNLAIALIFFILGRWIYIQMGVTGIWVIAILLVVFYTGWWALFRRKKGEK